MTNSFPGALQKLTFTNPAEFYSLNGLIHDESFDLDALAYDQEQGLVTIPFSRIYHDYGRQLVRQTFFSRTWEVAVLHALLRIRHVKAFTYLDTEEIGTYYFNEIRFSPATEELIILTVPSLNIQIRVSQIAIEYEETHTAGKAYIKLYWCGLETIWGA